MGGKRRGRGRRSSSSSSSSYSGNPFVIRSSGGGGSSQQNNQTGQNNQNTGRIKDTKVEQERNEGSYLDTMMPGGNITYREMNEGRSRTAYEASVAKQEELSRLLIIEN